MYCPSCRSEYRPGFVRCPDCNVDLVEELSGEVIEPTLTDPLDDLVPVFVADRFTAEMIRSVLEGSGIPAANSGAGVSGAYPVNVGTLGEGRVLVRKKDEAKAREIIEAAQHGDLELDES